MWSSSPFTPSLCFRCFSYFFCFSFLLPTVGHVGKSSDDVYCSLWTRIFEDDKFTLEVFWKNTIDRWPITGLRFMEGCHWLYCYLWPRKWNLRLEIPRQTTVDFSWQRSHTAILEVEARREERALPIPSECALQKQELIVLLDAEKCKWHFANSKR